MNDDVKAAVERFRDLIAPFSGGYVRVASRSCGGYNAHNYDEGICRDCGFDGMNPTGEMLLGEAQDLLAHIDGEPARIAAACEEVREACAQRVPSIGQPHDCFEAVRATPLTATPLGDALARAEEGVRYWTDLAQAEARDAAALRARVAGLEAQLAEWAEKDGNSPGYNLEKAKIYGRIAGEERRRAKKAEAERDALRAWVSAVSEALGAIEPVSDCRVELSADAAAALAESLRAQVEAARKVCELRIKTQWRVPDVYITAHDVLRAMDEAKNE